MRRVMYRTAALLLCVCLIAGCSAAPSAGGRLYQAAREKQRIFLAQQKRANAEAFTPWSEVKYTRPQLSRLEALSREAEQAASSGDVPKAAAACRDFLDAVDDFNTDYLLADIKTSTDLTDSSWAEEYEYCSALTGSVDRLHEELMIALAASPCRDGLEEALFGKGFFLNYDGESIWNDRLLELMNQDSELQSRYYALQSSDYEIGTQRFYDRCADDIADVMVELIRVRRQIAEVCGYSSYPDFANDYYYYRDYDAGDVESCLESIRKELVPLYRKWADLSNTEEGCTEAETFAYVRGTALAMGGAVQDAWNLMEAGTLFDITYSPNKYNSSFEVFLPRYHEPFVFMNPMENRYDFFTFAHEFGHFCNDYASGGSAAGIDVNEFFSQGMEYLSLCYGDADEEMIRMKLADSLCTYVEQACYASFEQEMYSLSDKELSRDGLYRLFEKTAAAYGMDVQGFDSREFITVTHFFTSPMYILSYIGSNDIAMQLYERELDEPGNGLAIFLNNLDTSQYYFLEFTQSAGLESPFAKDRITEVRSFLERELS